MSQWYPIVVSGDDGTSVHATATTAHQPDGYVHIWAKFQLPGMRPMAIHAKLELSKIENELLARVTVPPAVQAAGDVEVGKFMKKFRRKLKSAARKIARSKLVKGVVKTVKRAIDNPLVKAALAATPAGAAMYATRAAARVAAKAIKGNRAAKSFVSGVAEGARRGNPQALAAMRLMSRGVSAHMPRAATALSGADEPTQFRVIAGWAQSPALQLAAGAACGAWSPDGESAETAHEIDALNEFASSGAWEGVRWVAKRMGLHPMHTGELTAKGALLDGRAAQAARFG